MQVVTPTKIHNFAFLLLVTTYELKQDLGLFLLKIADSPG